MKKRPDLHAFVAHKVSGQKAQVWKHYVDNSDFVGVIVLPQSGVTGDTRYRDWRIDQIEITNNPYSRT